MGASGVARAWLEIDALFITKELSVRIESGARVTTIVSRPRSSSAQSVNVITGEMAAAAALHAGCRFERPSFDMSGRKEAVMNIVLWVFQVLLAVAFFAHGAMMV